MYRNNATSLPQRSANAGKCPPLHLVSTLLIKGMPVEAILPEQPLKRAPLFSGALRRSSDVSLMGGQEAYEVGPFELFDRSVLCFTKEVTSTSLRFRSCRKIDIFSFNN